MKYSSLNKPLVCMQTQSTCYKNTRKMDIKGVLWHSTGANNPTLKRYVQPSNIKPAEDSYTKEEWLQKLGVNQYNNSWNQIEVQAGLNCWIGQLADGTVTTIQTMPWDFRPWGCGAGSRGSCNDGWIQFEICEPNDLSDKNYFAQVYNEACEITAYLCELFNIDPNGTVIHNGIEVPTILCHKDSNLLGLGGNHGDVYHWFSLHDKDMNNVRSDVSGLLGTKSSVQVKTYEVVTPINKYINSADAIAQKNAKSEKLAAGTYYIYNKYPDGLKGVLNVSTDKTGNSAGSWINPKENVIVESLVPQPVTKVYRVRKTKDDAKTQAGAYASLTGAIDKCQEAGPEYHVFDWDWNIVYSYTLENKEQENVVEPEVALAAYELDYPEKTEIIDIIKITRTDVDCVKAIKKILSNNSSFDVEIAKTFFRLAPKYNIDPMMAIAQSILETGWFKYEGSAVTSDQHNYCGLGVTSTGIKGGSFDTIEDGVTAQLQHLFAYGSKEALPKGEKILDPRFNLVTRGIAPYWQQLAGRWACPGYDAKLYSTPQKAMEAEGTYGQKILAICKILEAIQVTELEVKCYFPNINEEMSETDVVKPELEEVEKQPVVDDIPEQAKPDSNITEDKAADLAALIFSCLKKLIKMLAEVFSKGE